MKLHYYWYLGAFYNHFHHPHNQNPHQCIGSRRDLLLKDERNRDKRCNQYSQGKHQLSVPIGLFL